MGSQRVDTDDRLSLSLSYFRIYQDIYPLHQNFWCKEISNQRFKRNTTCYISFTNLLGLFFSLFLMFTFLFIVFYPQQYARNICVLPWFIAFMAGKEATFELFFLCQDLNQVHSTLTNSVTKVLLSCITDEEIRLISTELILPSTLPRDKAQRSSFSQRPKIDCITKKILCVCFKEKSSMCFPFVY